LLAPALAWADTPGRLGDTAWGLPGIVRVGVPAAGPRRFAAAASAGYGFTEAQSETDGAHHRLGGSLAAAVSPIPALDVALRFDGRYDLHPDDGRGAHGAGVGDPRLLVRAGTAVGDFLIGGELGGWFPGKDAPSITPSAITADLNALGAWVPRGGRLVLGASAGFRFDNSRNAAPDPARLRLGDRLALGVSSSNAALLGVGISAPVAARTDVLGELSADFLVGSSAPAVSKSPMRITAGARHRLTDAIAVEILAEVSPSGRPSLAVTDPFVPVEPRFSITAGLRYRLPFDVPAAPPVEPRPAPETPRPAPAPVKETTSELVIQLHGEGGAPVNDALVDVRVGDKTIRLARDQDGVYRAKDLAPGTVHVTITADGFTPVERDVTMGGKPGDVTVELAPAPPSGQVRGLVRTFNGHGIAASVRVEPLGIETKTDAEGNFTLDVPPGDYEIVIRADRFKQQRRKIHVDQNGVTVLNAELFEKR
jgi:hypothetical protein